MVAIYFLLGVVLIINVYAFFVMMFDKLRSTKSGANRTPEGILFFLAAMGGSVGVYVGMYMFRHKTRRWYFQVGIPLLLLQQVTLGYLLYIKLFYT